MLKKQTLILVIFTAIVTIAFAQSSKSKAELSKAIYFFKQKNVEEAVMWIDKAYIGNSDNAKILYYRGFLYKEMYKRKKGSKMRYYYRDTAISNLLRAKKIGTVQALNKSLLSSLRYLSSTKFSDAINSMNKGKLNESREFFKEAKAIKKEIDAYDEKFKEREVDYLLLLASKYDEVISEGKVLDSIVIEKVGKIYEEIIVLSPNNAPAYYNYALLYYNNAVNIITTLDYSYPLEELIALQDYCVNYLFMGALPYMLKAYNLGYQKRQTTLGLQGIYYSLSDDKNFNKYKLAYESFLETGK